MGYLTPILVCASIFLSGCAGTTYKTEVIKQPDQKWQFRSISTFVDNKTTVVYGKILAHKRFGLLGGHIDIAAFSQNGDFIVETTTHYIPPDLTKRAHRTGGVRFRASLPIELPPNAVVKVAFHRDKPRPKTQPTHQGVIAH